MNNLSLVVYTNQTYLPIAELCIEQIDKHFEKVNLQKFLISNSFVEIEDFDKKDFNLIDTSVLFRKDGSHFSEVLVKALRRIDSEYVLFFLEDYLVITDVKKHVLENLLKIMDVENIDYLSLMSYEYESWEALKIDYEKYNLPNNLIIKFDYSYFYMFSVQPCIWKRESLITILEHNKNMSVHDFDTTRIKNKKGEIRHKNENNFWETPKDFWDYNFKFVTLNKNHLTRNFAFDERDIDGDYFLFLYSEIIRFGKFNLNTHFNNKKFLKKYLDHKQITASSEKFVNFF